MRLSYVIALVIAAGVAAWILSGDIGGSSLFSSADEAAVSATAAPALTALTAENEPGGEPFAVRVRTQTATVRPREITVRGHTEVSRSVVIRAEIAGTIDEIRVNKGDRVTAGQVLTTFELSDRPQRLAEVQALVAQRQLEFNIARSLAQQGQQPMTRMVAAQTALESALTALARIETEIAKTEIRAPFAGIIEDRQIQIGEFISPGSPAATLVDEDPFLVVGQVSEIEIDRITLGAAGTATLLDGREISGTVRFIALVADSQTRTFRVELEVANPGRDLRAGATADFTIPVGEMTAHLVSPAVLVLDALGGLGVKVVDAGGIVELVPVTVVAAANDGVWLEGLPATATIITVGQQFVTAGQAVTAVEEGQGAGL